MNAYANVNLLVIEDFDFIAIGGIESVITSFVPQLNATCGRLIWVLPEHKFSLRLDQNLVERSQIVSLKPDRFRAGWVAFFLSRIVAKLSIKSLSKLERMLASCAKKQRLEYLIIKYNLTHGLNLGVFNQKPPRVSIPIYGVVYDINFQPKWHDECLKNLRFWCQFSAGIFTISEWCKKQIADFVGEWDYKLYAVPVAIARPLSSHLEKRASSRSCECPILLYPASLSPHKNHATLLEALQSLHSKGYQFQLILCGPSTIKLLDNSTFEDSRLENTRAILNSSDPAFKSCIQILGMVNQEHLEDLYLEANLVVLPSTYEGFGLPLSEAISRGVRTICSDIPPFREQIDLYNIKQGVIFVEGHDPDDWALAVKMEFDQLCHQKPTTPDIDTLACWSWTDVAETYLYRMTQ
jgi:glycosyltransferase involved in cell wall biosynthesis